MEQQTTAAGHANSPESPVADRGALTHPRATSPDIWNPPSSQHDGTGQAATTTAGDHVEPESFPTLDELLALHYAPGAQIFVDGAEGATAGGETAEQPDHPASGDQPGEPPLQAPPARHPEVSEPVQGTAPASSAPEDSMVPSQVHFIRNRQRLNNRFDVESRMCNVFDGVAYFGTFNGPLNIGPAIEGRTADDRFVDDRSAGHPGAPVSAQVARATTVATSGSPIPAQSRTMSSGSVAGPSHPGRGHGAGDDGPAASQYWPISEDLSEGEVRRRMERNMAISEQRNQRNRQRNNAAARRSRQRRIQMIDELTTRLEAMTRERDLWRAMALAHGARAFPVKEEESDGDAGPGGHA